MYDHNHANSEYVNSKTKEKKKHLQKITKLQIQILFID